jgi:hypothetical protein
VEVGELQTRVAAQLAKADFGRMPAARTGHPIVLLLVLPQVLDGLYWHALARALDEASRVSSHITWRELTLATRAALHESSKALFGHLAESLETGARHTLLVWLLLQLLVQGGCRGASHLLARRRESKAILPASDEGGANPAS